MRSEHIGVGCGRREAAGSCMHWLQKHLFDAIVVCVGQGREQVHFCGKGALLRNIWGNRLQYDQPTLQAAIRLETRG
jgi:hypothetical protein